MSRTISRRTYCQVVSVPANTPQPGVQRSLLLVTAGEILESVRVRIPRGHNGRTGLQLWYEGTQVFPWRYSFLWLSGDDLITDVPLNVEEGSSLFAMLYNTDNVPHSFFVDTVKTDAPIPVGLPTGLAPVAVAL